jgi:IS5 family transposase
VVYADAGYQGIAKKGEMAGNAVEFRVATRRGKRRALPETPEGRMQDQVETAKANIRPKGEHPFRGIMVKLAVGRSSSSAFRRPDCVAW